MTGFIRVAVAAPSIRVGDVAHNGGEITRLMERAAQENVRLLCLPELCLTGYTCGDLFQQEILLSAAKNALADLAAAGQGRELITVLGLPLVWREKLYNVAAVIGQGRILGFVPKTHLPNYGEFYELRHFTPAPPTGGAIHIGGEEIPFGTDLLFDCREIPGFQLAVEICEDLWAPAPPSGNHAAAGATVIANLSASDEIIGKAGYRRSLVAQQSARLLCAYLYAGAGAGESSTDMVFSGHGLIGENSAILSESPPFGEGWAVTELDMAAILHERRRLNTFDISEKPYRTISFSLQPWEGTLTRVIDPHPFVPADSEERRARCEEILAIQSAGLVKRLEHTGCNTAVVGISGGLDSCLALLVTHRAFERMHRDPAGILAVTMPCFGTTARTRRNAELLCEALGVTFREADITEEARIQLRTIGHSEEDHAIVFENVQARIRTLVLMNLANQTGGLVIGTGDLSELALGWATYNGDHMSMYGVNAGVPKTLVRYLVEYVRSGAENPALEAVLADILATPVSPELLPPVDGVISQQTEELVGPYELHDFTLYHLVRRSRRPAQILELAAHAFAGVYDRATILRWLRVFCRRFFAQQFKRSCLPDGPKVGSVTLSPRGDWRMPSDASPDLWLEELL